MTVYTGGSSTGQKFDAAEMGFSPGRPKIRTGRKFVNFCKLFVNLQYPKATKTKNSSRKARPK